MFFFNIEIKYALTKLIETDIFGMTDIAYASLTKRIKSIIM